MPSRYVAICILIMLFGNCERENPETTVSGKVTDDKGKPVRQMPVSVTGQKKGTLSSYRILVSTYTDSSGNYHTSFIPAKGYNQLMVLPDLGLGYPQDSDYKDIQFQPGFCCPVAIGATQQYSFTMISR